MEVQESRWDTELSALRKAILRAWHDVGGTATKAELKDEIISKPKFLRRAQDAERMLQESTQESWQALVLEFMKAYGTKTGERRGEGKGFVVYALTAEPAG